MPTRAVLIETVNCRDVRLEDFSTEQADMWSIHLVYCENVVARRLTIRSTGGDGIDVDSCRHVVIDQCDIDTGDDAIAIKSGRGMEGYQLAKPTEDVLISNCTLGDSRFAAIGIGSETSGGIRNVRIEHVTVTHAKARDAGPDSQHGLQLCEGTDDRERLRHERRPDARPRRRRIRQADPELYHRGRRELLERRERPGRHGDDCVRRRALCPRIRGPGYGRGVVAADCVVP